MIRRLQRHKRTVAVHVCDVPFVEPERFSYQYGGIVGVPTKDDESSGIEYDPDAECWAINITEYACPIKFCPLCGVDLIAVEGRPA